MPQAMIVHDLSALKAYRARQCKLTLPTLIARRGRLARYIAAFACAEVDRRTPPTIVELAKSVGCQYPTAMKRALRDLLALNLLVKKPNVARGMQRPRLLSIPVLSASLEPIDTMLVDCRLYNSSAHYAIELADDVSGVGLQGDRVLILCEPYTSTHHALFDSTTCSFSLRQAQIERTYGELGGVVVGMIRSLSKVA
ncbi:hypothetical protein QTV44_002532 [Vibrio vulnificus]|nr:hypothetical protein [Vibrio vulnificus]